MNKDLKSSSSVNRGEAPSSAASWTRQPRNPANHSILTQAGRAIFTGPIVDLPFHIVLGQVIEEDITPQHGVWQINQDIHFKHHTTPSSPSSSIAVIIVMPTFWENHHTVAETEKILDTGYILEISKGLFGKEL